MARDAKEDTYIKSEDYDPANPGRRLKWSSHDIGDFQRCPWRYYARHVLRYGAKTDGKQHFGKAVHAGLDAYHTADGDHDTRLIAAVRAALTEGVGLPPLEADKGRSLANVVRCVIAWADDYGIDSDGWAPLAGEPDECSEVAFEVPLLVIDNGQFYLRGRFDRVVQHRRGTAICDPKTTGASASAYYFRKFNPSSQMSLYAGVGDLLFDDFCKVILLDAIFFRESKREGADITPIREELRIEDGPEAIEDAKYWIRLADQMFFADHWPRNRNGCNGPYGMCVYAGVCNQPKRKRMSILQQEFVYGGDDEDEDD